MDNTIDRNASGIPKMIHYCWISDAPLPRAERICFNSWKKTLPDYRIKKWDIRTLQDAYYKLVTANGSLSVETPNTFSVLPIWVKEAYRAKLYAFVADYVRLFALYTEGGIYLDTDVQVFRTFDDLLDLKYFFGQEGNNDLPEAAVIGAEKGCEWIKESLRYYYNRSFYKTLTQKGPDYILPYILKRCILSKWNLVKIRDISEVEWTDHTSIYMLPSDWFSASKTVCAPNYAYTLHYGAHGWMRGNKPKIKRFFANIFGYRFLTYLYRLLRRLFR